MSIESEQDCLILKELNDNLDYVADSFIDFSYSSNKNLLLHGDCLNLLKAIPDESFDCVITSPPYWAQREYDEAGIGLENTLEEYLDQLEMVFYEVKRVLKASGSLWLNLGDTYHNKHLLGVPWRLAFRLIDNQCWILRNSIIWDKIKGGLNSSTDRLANIHENIFHFVKDSKKYYYNDENIRSEPRKAKVIDGRVISATGVTGVSYKRKIELSTTLSEDEKKNAIEALNKVLEDIKNHKISDFRMVIRGTNRATHSNSERLSGRARELQNNGFYFLKYSPKGSKPNDIWSILPEDSQKRKLHFAPYPLDLCTIPILTTCPPEGIILDPFCGTGTTLLAAKIHNRKSVGIDTSLKYIDLSFDRLIEKQ